MTEIRETWTIEATAGTVGVNENTFQFAIINRNEAATAEEAIELVAAQSWKPSGNKSVASVFARKSFALADTVGIAESGEPGSVGIPDFDSIEEAQASLDE